MKTQQAEAGGYESPAREQVSADPFKGNIRFGFESHKVPASERVDMTCELAGQLFPGFHLLPPTDPGFRAGISALRAGDLVIGRGYATSMKFELGSKSKRSSYQSLGRQDEHGVFWIYQRGGGKSAAGRRGWTARCRLRVVHAWGDAGGWGNRRRAIAGNQSPQQGPSPRRWTQSSSPARGDSKRQSSDPTAHQLHRVRLSITRRCRSHFVNFNRFA
jgi:hypothetical protein